MAPVTAEVEFHTGVDDSVGFACRLLRKAYRQGARVRVTAPPALLAELDRALWVFDDRDFVPHVRVPGVAPAIAARTPIWLSADVGGVEDAVEGVAAGADAGAAAVATLPAAPRVVVNLGAAAPGDVASLERLIEVVSTDPDDADRGRARWRAYKAAGLQIKHHAGGGQ